MDNFEYNKTEALTVLALMRDGLFNTERPTRKIIEGIIHAILYLEDRINEIDYSK